MTILQHDFSDQSGTGLTKLKSIIQQNAITAIYLSDRAYHDVMYLRLRTWGVQSIVLHFHYVDTEAAPTLYRKILRTFRYLIPGLSCDLIIGVSRFAYERFIENQCIPKNKCTYVLNGIFPIDIQEKNRYLFRDQFGIPRDAVIIVTTGRAATSKGINFILRCAERIISKERTGKTFFIHCGDGPDLDAFMKLSIDLGISSYFRFAGKRSDVRELLQSCDIAIHASDGEAFSLAILEYMSAGLATVVPAHCGNVEAITNGEDGVLYTPRDIEMAVRVLTELIQDQVMRNRLGKNAIRAVYNKFHISRTNAELIERLSDVF